MFFKKKCSPLGKWNKPMRVLQPDVQILWKAQSTGINEDIWHLWKEHSLTLLIAGQPTTTIYKILKKKDKYHDLINEDVDNNILVHKFIYKYKKMYSISSLCTSVGELQDWLKHQ